MPQFLLKNDRFNFTKKTTNKNYTNLKLCYINKI